MRFRSIFSAALYQLFLTTRERLIEVPGTGLFPGKRIRPWAPQGGSLALIHYSNPASSRLRNNTNTSFLFDLVSNDHARACP